MSTNPGSGPRRSRPIVKMVAGLAAVVAVTPLLAAAAAAEDPPPPRQGFCVGTDPDSAIPAPEGSCGPGQRWLTPQELDQLKGTLNESKALGDLSTEFTELGDPRTTPASFPADWYKSVAPCTLLPTTDADGSNKIATVYVAKTFELAAQIAYDIASNELTGIAGAITGTILGATRVPAFALDWIYQVQDECQEEVMENRVDVAISSRASQASLDALSAQVGTHDTQVQAKLDAISAALAAHDSAMTTLINDHHAAMTTLVITETDEIDADLAATRDENVRFYIEDHLDTCRPLTTLLVSAANGGYAEKTFAVTADLIDLAETDGLDIGQARRFFQTAEDHAAAGDARKAFSALCSAYSSLALGG